MIGGGMGLAPVAALLQLMDAVPIALAGAAGLLTLIWVAKRIWRA
jgi:hypothetical protein